ncbi:MAG: bis(5'-nucleosyl)-tetraphosphatase (symmetrical) YqeK [Caldicoprobacterales bacterium]|jgi:predicted HD superfamily hydrolase involved in NAD metabolism|nr:HD domain-containing protein [Clostridiales bacterium]
MTSQGGIVEKLKEWLGEKRLNHSLGVSRCAAELARHYGADVEKAELAGLIHDCAKDLSFKKALELGKKYGFEPDTISRMNPALLHAPLGAYLARDVFGVQDDEILQAIACHTTGKENMTLLDKIICLADFIEESRSYPGVEKIKALAFVDINRALLTGLELSIQAVLQSGRLLHPMTVEARNALLLEIKNAESA